MINIQNSYEQDQRCKVLQVILWVALVVSFGLGFFDLQFHTWVSVVALFGMGLACIPCLILNDHNHFFLAALFLSILVLAAITFNLYDGDGIHDPGILAYPIFIMIGTLLFGKRASPFFALAAVASLTTIVLLQVFGRIHPHIGATNYGILIPTITLLLAAAAIIWVIVDNIEKNLARARSSEAELRMNYDLTLEAWAKVLELRDRETEGHSRRLVDLSTRLARRLGIGEAEILHLQRGALVHDIGKLAIPDDILLKPSSLDEKEKKYPPDASGLCQANAFRHSFSPALRLRGL